MESSAPKRWHASNISTMPHMEQEGIDLLKSRLVGCEVFLEYGAGGSTVFAAMNGAGSIFSVESDRFFLEAVSDRLSGIKAVSTDFHQVYVDLGPTGDWGVPTDKTTAERWPNYCVKVWEEFLSSSNSPDLVLIDGRFRVACFLASLLFAKEGCTILFDDYVNRPNYHIVERFLKPASVSGRMAEFVKVKGLPEKQIMIELIKFSTSTA